MQPTLVLWDIDHTLVELRKLHYKMYAHAFEAAFKRPVDQLPDMSGRTDRDSSTELLQAHDIEATEVELQRFWAAFGPTLDKIAPDLSQQGHATDGADRALAALGEIPDVHQGVLTGNLRFLAHRKLAAFGLDRYLDLAIGGYGEDHTNRSQLVSIARGRLYERCNVRADADQTTLVGDTQKDIQAAKESGARIVAVATGSTSAQDLVAAGADMVLDDLRDTEATLRAVLTVAR